MTLFIVKYQYCRMVDAPSKSEAYKSAVKAIKDDPDSVIAKIEPEGSGRMSTGKLLKMLIFG